MADVKLRRRAGGLLTGYIIWHVARYVGHGTVYLAAGATVAAGSPAAIVPTVAALPTAHAAVEAGSYALAELVAAFTPFLP